MNITLRNVSIILACILVIIGIIYVYQNFIFEEKIVESTGGLYELVSKEKFLTQAPIIAKIEPITSTEKNIILDNKDIPIKEWELIIKEMYKGNLSNNQQITIYDDRYNSSEKVINYNNETIYGTTSSIPMEMQLNKEYLLFLMEDTETSNMYKVFCGFQGIFTYDEQKNMYVNKMNVEIYPQDLLKI